MSISSPMSSPETAMASLALAEPQQHAPTGQQPQLHIPQLRSSMTPWRLLPDAQEPPPAQQQQATELHVRAALTASELETLQATLLKYKIRANVLEEVVKNINSSNDNNTFYHGLLDYVSQREEIGRLTAANEALRTQLARLQDEYTTTLEYLDEHMRNNDAMAAIFDSILHNVAAAVALAGEKKASGLATAVQDALDAEPSFLMVKLDAIASLWHDEHFTVVPRPVDSSAERSAERSPNDSDDKIATMANSTQLVLDPHTEHAIETLHKHYDDFIKQIAVKFDKAATLEASLHSKLQRQETLLDSIQAACNSTDENEKKEGNPSYAQWDSISSGLVNQVNDLKATRDRFEAIVSQLNSKVTQLNAELVLLRQDNKRIRQEEDLRRSQDNSDTRQQLQQQVQRAQRNELEFQRFQNSIVLHLNNVFNIMEVIIQRESLDQTKRKIQSIKRLGALAQLAQAQPKFESLFQFVETAMDTIIKYYTDVVVAANNGKGKSNSKSKDKHNPDNTHYKLRIDELQRRWETERERRKMDSTASLARIDQLESENLQLKQQLQRLEAAKR